MKLLANENFPGDAVEALRAAGHDVLWVRTAFPGASDPHVLERAIVEQRILLTFDKDFGELAFRSDLPATSGIILFRMRLISPAHISRAAVAAIGSRTDWAGHFSVVEEGRVRMTALAGTPKS
jgi:predicted nuclease of predicted toxin-antitoxin system